MQYSSSLLSMHHETRYFPEIDGSRHAMREAFSGCRALPIVTRKFSVAGPGRAPSPRVAWQSPTWSKPSLTCVGKQRIAPGTNKFTPMSEGGPRCFILFLSFGRQTKTAIRGRKRPRMASMPLLSKLVTQAYTAQRTSKVVTQASSAA